MERNASDQDEREGEADEGSLCESTNHQEDAEMNAAVGRRLAAEWIRDALEPCRAEAEKHELMTLLYLLNMASLEARDIGKKSE